MSDVFALARAKLDVGALVGATSHASHWRQLRGRKHPCPICSGHDCFSFLTTGWRCHATGESGDAIGFAARLWDCTVFEAACRAIGASPEEERKKYAEGKAPGDRKPKRLGVLSKPFTARPAERPETDQDVQAVIDRIVMQLTGGQGTLVEAYMESRALPRSFARHALFCPDAPYDREAAFGRGRAFPAMVFFVERGGVKTGGLHVTYLRADGAGKADALRAGEPAKKMWGPQLDAFGRAAGIVLIPPTPGALLCVAEGVENALAMAHVAGHGAGAFAAGSLNRFQGGMAQGPWGGADWRKPAPDLEQPAATILHRGPVLLGTDGDMKPITINRGTRFERTIEPARRQQVSGVLAGFWWKRAGATDVRVLTTPAGKDANDVLREAAA